MNEDGIEPVHCKEAEKSIERRVMTDGEVHTLHDYEVPSARNKQEAD